LTSANEFGFVTIHEIQNIFISHLREMEMDMRVNRVPANPKVIFDWVDEIRAEIISKARINVEEYLRQNPDLKKDAREAKLKNTDSDLRKSWQERVQKRRTMGFL
jgi:hypothetical protein